MNLTAAGLGLSGYRSLRCVYYAILKLPGIFAVLLDISGSPAPFRIRAAEESELQVATLCNKSWRKAKEAGGDAEDYALTGMTQPTIK